MSLIPVRRRKAGEEESKAPSDYCLKRKNRRRGIKEGV
jgi:hypothetical protein